MVKAFEEGSSLASPNLLTFTFLPPLVNSIADADRASVGLVGTRSCSSLPHRTEGGGESGPDFACTALEVTASRAPIPRPFTAPEKPAASVSQILRPCEALGLVEGVSAMVRLWLLW